MEIKTCSNCDKPVAFGNFCPYCGNKMSSDVAAQPTEGSALADGSRWPACESPVRTSDAECPDCGLGS